MSLEVGDKAPDFSLPADGGTEVALKDHAAAATPGPEPERSSEPYSPALLM